MPIPPARSGRRPLWGAAALVRSRHAARRSPGSCGARSPAWLSLVATLCAFIVTSPTAGARQLIQNKGSDSLAVAVQAWADAYRRVEPDTGIAVNAGGSGTGIASLLNGTADIANSSRRISEGERSRARALGLDPIEHLVGHDVVGVFVHPDNPVASLTFGQLGELYGRRGSVEKWSDLGVTVPGCKDQVVVRVGRQNSSGTYAYFRAAALGGDKYRQGTLAVRGTRHVVDLVSTTPCAIGYASIAYITDGVLPVCLTSAGSQTCVLPSAAAAAAGTYPLSRPLLMYTVGKPSDVIARYLEWVVSNAGQCIAERRGYVPLRPDSCQD